MAAPSFANFNSKLLSGMKLIMENMKLQLFPSRNRLRPQPGIAGELRSVSPANRQLLIEKLSVIVRLAVSNFRFRLTSKELKLTYC